MDSIYILVPIALLLTAVALKAFFWAVDNKQFDDLDAAAQSILFDDDQLVDDKARQVVQRPDADQQQKHAKDQH